MSVSLFNYDKDGNRYLRFAKELSRTLNRPFSNLINHFSIKDPRWEILIFQKMWKLRIPGPVGGFRITEQRFPTVNEAIIQIENALGYKINKSPRHDSDGFAKELGGALGITPVKKVRYFLIWTPSWWILVYEDKWELIQASTPGQSTIEGALIPIDQALDLITQALPNGSL